MRRIDGISARYVITVSEQDQTKPPDFVNVVSLPVLEQVRRDPRFTACRFPSKEGIVVFRFAPRSQASEALSPTSSESAWPTPSTTTEPPAISAANVESQDEPAQHKAFTDGCGK